MRYLLLLAVFPTMLFAQVGIGTSDPRSDLHIAGSASTIRIESLSAANTPVYNNGIKPARAFVTAMGDVTIDPSTNNGVGPNGTISPIKFLLSEMNFIPNGATNRGTILNNSTAVTTTSSLITAVPFTSPRNSVIEVKYSISALLSSTDLNAAITPFNDVSTRTFKIYFCVDIGNNGLSATELSRKFGLNGQCYSSGDQGILGYSFTNGTGYTSIPMGSHSLHFFAEVTDGASKYTSIGFGGVEDFLRIRVYN